MRRFSMSGPFSDSDGNGNGNGKGNSNSNSKAAVIMPQQSNASGELGHGRLCKRPHHNGVPKNIGTVNTWPILKDQHKGSSYSGDHQSDCSPKHSEPVYSQSVLSNSSARERVKDKHLTPIGESRRSVFGRAHSSEKPQVLNNCMHTDLGYRHVRRKPQVLDTCMQELKCGFPDFTARLESLAAEQSGENLGVQSPCKSRRLKSVLCDGDEAFLANNSIQPDEDLGKLDLKLGNQFERLLNAIDNVTEQMQTAFEGLHERVDVLQASLEADYDLRWKKLKDHLNQQGTPESGVRNRGVQILRSTGSLEVLEEAAEIAREDIRILTGLLIVEKDADLMLARDFQDRQVMLLKMMEPYLKKPAFDQFWQIKHGLDHCVASVMFKTSNVLARTQSITGSGSGADFLAEDIDGAQFKRFYRKGQKGLEMIADWEEGKWSAQLKKEVLNACRGVWQLQSMVADLRITHQVEFLQPEPGCKLDEATMDPLDCLLENHFQPLVQFTIFPGFKIDDTVLMKSQVYLQPKCNSMVL